MRCIALASLLAFLAISACKQAPSHERLAGEWHSRVIMTNAQKAKYPNWEELMETLNSVTVIIEKKGTYSIWLPDGRVSGNVRVEGDIATFTPEKINGQPLAEVRAKLSQNVPVADLRQALKTLDEISEPETMRIGKGGKVLEWVEASADLTHWLEKPN